MQCLRNKYLSALFVMVVTYVHADPASADSGLGGGKPRIGIELEHEKAPNDKEIANSVTIIPGIKWDDGWINLAEILLQAEHEKEKEDAAWVHETKKKVGIRLQKDFHMTDKLRGSVRGLVGRTIKNDDSYTFAYIEPAMKYLFDSFDFSLGYRITRSIDGSEGHDTNKIRFGPSLDIGKHHRVEFRWARSWDAHTDEHKNDAYIAEYIYKF